MNGTNMLDQMILVLEGLVYALSALERAAVHVNRPDVSVQCLPRGEEYEILVTLHALQIPLLFLNLFGFLKDCFYSPILHYFPKLNEYFAGGSPNFQL